MFSHELLNLTYDTIEFVDQIRMIAVLAETRSQGFGNTKTVPSFFPLNRSNTSEAMSSKLSQNRTRVVQLIRR